MKTSQSTETDTAITHRIARAEAALVQAIELAAKSGDGVKASEFATTLAGLQHVARTGLPSSFVCVPDAKPESSLALEDPHALTAGDLAELARGLDAWSRDRGGDQELADARWVMALLSQFDFAGKLGRDGR